MFSVCVCVYIHAQLSDGRTDDGCTHARTHHARSHARRRTRVRESGTRARNAHTFRKELDETEIDASEKRLGQIRPVARMPARDQSAAIFNMERDDLLRRFYKPVSHNFALSVTLLTVIYRRYKMASKSFLPTVCISYHKMEDTT